MSKLNIFSFLGFGKKKPMTAADLMSEDAKAAAAWIETVNPLRGMTAQRMQNLYDASRNGDTVHLQWLYNEIEKVDPTLLICAQRRRGALASLDWTIKTRSEKRVRGFDAKLAEEQFAALEAAFGDAEMANFNDAVDHLAGAFFRGFAHILPVWSADGLSIKRFETLDQWNFCRDIQTGTWYWNPEANAYTDYSSCRPIPDGEVVAMVAPYHIDYPAMTIYLRSAVGEKGWARFVERFGIPPCILTLPSDIPNDQISAWRTAAEKVAEGGSGAMPNGTGVNFCDGARGINPFKDFIHNQRELVVLMSTGGMLTSLTEAGSGTLAGNAHADTWAEIRRMDSAKIGSVINRDLAGRILDRAFPGKPHLAYFAFATEAVPSPGEVFDDAGKARTAGYLVDKAQLEEMTGYKLEKIEEVENRGGGGEWNAHPFMNKKIVPSPSSYPPAQQPEGAARRGATGADKDLLAAFAKDTSEAGKAVAELLKKVEEVEDVEEVKEAAAALLAKLDTLLPDDPATAAVIAEAMAKEFGAAKVENKEGVCTSPNGPAGCKSPTCPGKKSGRTRKGRERHTAPSYVPDPDDITKKRISSVAHGVATKALADTSFNGAVGIGFVPSSVAVAVAKSTKGPNQVDVEGYRQIIPASRIRKADKKHGQQRVGKDGSILGERRPEQKPLSQSDYDRISIVKTSPDSIRLGSSRQGLPMLQYSKTFDDGTITTVWEVSKSAKQERFYDMWKK